MSDGLLFCDQIPDLLESHFQQLCRGSGISPQVMAERGYRSIVGREELANIGFSAAQQLVPGILLPIWGIERRVVDYLYRPDEPRLKKGKVVKYENLPHSSNCLDIPPRCLKDVGNPSVDLWIAEGTKKGDSLATLGACVGYSGLGMVWPARIVGPPIYGQARFRLKQRWLIVLSEDVLSDEPHGSIAHEIAHAYLGHDRQAIGTSIDVEYQACDLAAKWGFGGQDEIRKKYEAADQVVRSIQDQNKKEAS